MLKKSVMSLSTINTILNTAPIVIQGASRLIKMIREQSKVDKVEEEKPDTIETIQHEIDQLHQRLEINDESNVEQIKLIEELAKQNESLATQLKKTITQLNRIALLAVIAIFVAVVSLTFQLI